MVIAIYNLWLLLIEIIIDPSFQIKKYFRYEWFIFDKIFLWKVLHSC